MVLYERRTHVNQLILLASDMLVVFGTFRLIAFIQRGDWQFSGDLPVLFAVFALLWWIVAKQCISPMIDDRLLTYVEKFRSLAMALLIHAVVLTAGTALLQVRILPIRYLMLLYVMAGSAIISSRLLVAFIYRSYRSKWAQPRSRFVIVGTSRSGRDLYRFLTVHDPIANQFLGFFSDSPNETAHDIQDKVRGRLADLKGFCLQEQVDEIYFALPLNQPDLIQDLSSFADDNFIGFRIVPDFEGTLRKGVNVHYNGRGPVITVRRQPLAFQANQIAKRAFDILFSGMVIVGVFPIIMPILALLIKLDSPGPIFFKQMRPGKRNKLFPCYKLRTMRNDHGRTELQASKSDNRVTRIGRFLRASSLDELPQFFNVWLGQMSVVGPRPNMLSQLEEYSKRIQVYPQRHAVTPGITGYAQVNGFRGETRAEGAMEKRVEYDLKYMEDWSLLLDVQIIGKTVWNMVVGEKNAY
jgi:putative colanic acid biosynthesis UDP-glucose lipid carrier transferase